LHLETISRPNVQHDNADILAAADEPSMNKGPNTTRQA